MDGGAGLRVDIGFYICFGHPCPFGLNIYCGPHGALAVAHMPCAHEGFQNPARNRAWHPQRRKAWKTNIYTWRPGVLITGL